MEGRETERKREEERGRERDREEERGRERFMLVCNILTIVACAVHKYSSGYRDTGLLLLQIGFTKTKQRNRVYVNHQGEKQGLRKPVRESGFK